jgi:hypothetical protein
MDAIHRAGVDACRVLGADTGFCNYISHSHLQKCRRIVARQWGKPNYSLTAVNGAQLAIETPDLAARVWKNGAVGLVGNLRPIGNRPVNNEAFPNRPITNRPQDTILPHKIRLLERVAPHLLDNGSDDPWSPEYGGEAQAIGSSV